MKIAVVALMTVAGLTASILIAIIFACSIALYLLIEAQIESEKAKYRYKPLKRHNDPG